jgi:hypothetical protein
MAFHSWVTSSFVRHFPLTPVQSAQPLAIRAALNERFSFQVAVHATGGQRPLSVQVEVSGPKDWDIRVRRIGYVPVRHRNTPVEAGCLDADGAGFIPGFVPDPLFDENTILLARNETHAFWVTVCPGQDAHPGQYPIWIRVSGEKGDEVEHSVSVHLHNLLLKRRTHFPVTNWFYVDSLIDWYKTDLFDERLWDILANYVRNLVEHGQDTLYVPAFTPPLDGVKRPTQLLRVQCRGPEEYEFDWQDVRRYVRLADKLGVAYFEWCHLFTQWGAEHPLRVYEGQGRDERLLWDPGISATSQTYRVFLEQFLPELERFLVEEQIAERSFFHVSDEPHGVEHLENYRAARALLKELAPWMKVMDALSDLVFAQEGLIDLPVPHIRVAPDFVQAGIPCWCYYCVGLRGRSLNRLLDTPLAKIAMHGFLFYRWPFEGFLHWGYNYWYQEMTRNLIDPYTVQDSLHWEKGWVYGDSFLVYPGEHGPVDSVRWEVIAEALQDYALLQTLDVDRNCKLLQPIKSFEEFPKMEAWRLDARAQLLTLAEC